MNELSSISQKFSEDHNKFPEDHNKFPEDHNKFPEDHNKFSEDHSFPDDFKGSRSHLNSPHNRCEIWR